MIAGVIDVKRITPNGEGSGSVNAPEVCSRVVKQRRTNGKRDSNGKGNIARHKIAPIEVYQTFSSAHELHNHTAVGSYADEDEEEDAQKTPPMLPLDSPPVLPTKTFSAVECVPRSVARYDVLLVDPPVVDTLVGNARYLYELMLPRQSPPETHPHDCPPSVAGASVSHRPPPLLTGTHNMFPPFSAAQLLELSLMESRSSTRPIQYEDVTVKHERLTCTPCSADQGRRGGAPHGANAAPVRRISDAQPKRRRLSYNEPLLQYFREVD